MPNTRLLIRNTVNKTSTKRKAAILVSAGVFVFVTLALTPSVGYDGISLLELSLSHPPSIDETKASSVPFNGNDPADLSMVDLPLCTRAQLVDGSWEPHQYDRMPYLPITIPEKTCYTANNLKQPWNTYRWLPSASRSPGRECRWDDWNVNEFCDLAYNQTIALVADSLTLEFFSALVHMLGVTDFIEEVSFTENVVTFTSYVYPHNTTKISLYRNNHLWLKGTRNFILRDNFNFTDQPDLVILNRGAWYENDEKLLRRIHQLVDRVLTPWQQQCLARRQHLTGSNTNSVISHSFCRVVWRTTVPGHPQCTSRPEFKKPATSVAAMEAWIANLSHYDEQTYRYHWYDFQHQNRLVEEFFVNFTNGSIDAGNISDKEQPHLEVDILDAHKINILRPDERIAQAGKKDDCMHNCQPSGSTLFYIQWLLHLMRRTRQETNMLYRL